MATSIEIQSLSEINYRIKFKIIILFLLTSASFTFAFLNFYPLSDKIKQVMKAQFNGKNCQPDFDEIRMEWFLPKLVVSDVKIPASCLDRDGEPLKFNHLTINYHLINFAPFGLPFKLTTEFQGQPLEVYFVQGFGVQMVRLKDQTLNLSRIQPLLGPQIKMAGNLMVDLSLRYQAGEMSSFEIKSQSKDFNFPSQNLQGFTTPPLKISEFYLQANSAGKNLKVEKLILGDTKSPLRANFKGNIQLQSGSISQSPLDLAGEMAFSPSLRQALPLIDMMFQAFNQKDGFYQIKMRGTLGSPKPSAP